MLNGTRSEENILSNCSTNIWLAQLRSPRASQTINLAGESGKKDRSRDCASCATDRRDSASAHNGSCFFGPGTADHCSACSRVSSHEQRCLAYSRGNLHQGTCRGSQLSPPHRILLGLGVMALRLLLTGTAFAPAVTATPRDRSARATAMILG
jgi:hypothetical protein